MLNQRQDHASDGFSGKFRFRCDLGEVEAAVVEEGAGYEGYDGTEVVVDDFFGEVGGFLFGHGEAEGRGSRELRGGEKSGR